MKRLCFLILALLAFVSCKDDDGDYQISDYSGEYVCQMEYYYYDTDYLAWYGSEKYVCISDSYNVRLVRNSEGSYDILFGEHLTTTEPDYKLYVFGDGEIVAKLPLRDKWKWDEYFQGSADCVFDLNGDMVGNISGKVRGDYMGHTMQTIGYGIVRLSPVKKSSRH